MSAFIEIKPGRYFAVIAILYGSKPRDWLATVWRDPGEELWHLTYRFRFYDESDPSAWSGKDRKSGYEATVHGEPEAAIVHKVRMVGEILAAEGFNDRLDMLVLGTDDPDAIMRALEAMPWAHMKTLPAPS